jgi:hypothetical protein
LLNLEVFPIVSDTSQRWHARDGVEFRFIRAQPGYEVNPRVLVVLGKGSCANCWAKLGLGTCQHRWRE